MYDNTKIWRSLIIFLAALLLVYVVFFDVWNTKWIDAQNITAQNNINFPQFPNNLPPLARAPLTEKNQWIDTLNSDSQEKTESIDIKNIDGKRFYSTQYLFSQKETNNPITLTTTSIVDNKITLKDTFERTWDMELLEILDINSISEYILKDNLNTHYVYLWRSVISLWEKVESIWWTHVDIIDQFTIFENQYFWSRVQKILLPSYKNNLKDILIITLSNWESWLIQMDNNVSNIDVMKNDIRNRFSEYYSI